jgi:hypothetical protein
VDGEAARGLALSFPEAEEKETWGHPTFRVRDRMFMAMAAGGTTVSVKATRDAHAARVGSEPETFSIPAYVGRHGCVGVVLDRVDPEELAELVEDAWRMTAPKRVVRAFDARR